MNPEIPDRSELIYLVSMPWPLFNRPSIQLGTLKAFLNQTSKNLRVKNNHLYLNVAAAVGYEVYKAISKRTWLSECVYGALLYPRRFDAIENLFHKEAHKDDVLSRLDFRALTQTVRQVTDEILGHVAWQKVGLIGFSVCLSQLTATLYAARQIKTKSPDTIVVAGGSTLSNPDCRRYLDVFKQLDAIVIGEGELTLAALLSAIQTHGGLKEAPNLTGVITPATKEGDVACFSQVTNLDILPTPDYADYFHRLTKLPQEKHFFATLPVEVSRGCWWQDKVPPNKPRGCAFCNLNLQWDGYRQKASPKVVADIGRLTTRHQTLSVAFMDNVLPPGSSHELFSELGQVDQDLKMFAEIRATTKLDALERMRSAGMHEVQVGIEALSTGLLQKMNKGTTAIQNLAVMKHCEALGLRNLSNLILYFPGSEEADVSETLNFMQWARTFQPLKPVAFWLGLGSPVWQNPKSYGILSTRNHPHYNILFPKQITAKVLFPIQTYRGDRMRQRKLWKPVETELRQWHQYYEDMHQYPQTDPILSYRDGETFLIIRQRRRNKDPWQHRLNGTSREIYLFCQQIRPVKRIRNQFSGVSEDQLMPFLNMMVDKKLMVAERGRFLSLAIPNKNRF